MSVHEWLQSPSVFRVSVQMLKMEYEARELEESYTHVVGIPMLLLNAKKKQETNE